MIGLFNECFPPVMDGVSITVYNLAQQFYKAGQDVSVITPSCPGLRSADYPFDILTYFSLPVPIRPPYRCGMPFLDMKFQRTLEETKFDVVHAHSPFSSGKLALKVARAQGIPLVATFHSKYRDDFMRIFKNETIVNHIIRQIVDFYEQADEVWVPQASVGRTLRSYGYKGHYSVMENGCEFAGMKYSEQGKQEARQMLHIDNNDPILLFVGQHIWEKNLRLVVEALNKIAKTPYHAVFVGDGYAREELIAMATRMGLTGHTDYHQDKVTFLGSITDRELIRQIYMGADLLLFPSMYDNAPLVVREAAAMHTPAIVARHSNTSEIITDNYNGFIADNNVDAFAARLKELLGQPRLLAKASEIAPRTIVRSWKSVAEETLRRYQLLIGLQHYQVA